MATFHAATFESDAEGEDALSGLLWRTGGCLGLQILPGPAGGSRIVAHFDRRHDDAVFAAIAAAGGGRFLDTVPFAERDWLQPFRAAAQPFEVGDRWAFDPREPGASPPASPGAGRILLRVPARTAFGTGTHESTRLVLEWMEHLEFPGRRVVDVGAGSGILALAAMRLGARGAIAFDNDVAAAVAVRENALLNRVAGIAAVAGSSDGFAPRAAFDVALVNVVPEQVRPLLPWLASAVRRGGDAVFSGVLDSQAADTTAELARVGFAVRGSRRAAEWTALRAART